jgi:hypothetical protein
MGEAKIVRRGQYVAPPLVIPFMSATGGTTLEYDDGNKRYRSHTFTSNGTFEVTELSNVDEERNKVDYLIIAGGGGSGFGGGGAGGYRTTLGTQGGLGTLDIKPTVTATTYSVVVGAGGNASTAINIKNNGHNSSVAFSPSVVSIGGGAGGSQDFANTTNTVNAVGENGGSGGGGGVTGQTGLYNGGLGTSHQGFGGGQGRVQAGIDSRSGGGGGAGEAGGTPTSHVGVPGGKGGDGLANLLRTGSNEIRGGGGAGRTTTTGGSGGGGDTNENGQANTGGGAGGATDTSNGRAGGSGIVIIRYEIAPQ